ncbi:MAG: tetratricopeptide repeat protein [Planctomycetes bacterium]|nr:tetratricopeptide repeat protein [Planctomycetota bacterium]
MSRTTARRLTLAVVLSLFVYALACYSPISWSPDGKYVAFVQSVEGEKEGELVPELWLVDVTANRGERIAAGKAAFSAPAWSPDGAKIAFIQTDAESLPQKPDAGTGMKASLVLYDMKSKKTAKVCDTFVPVGRDDTGTILRVARLAPTWSPDGQRLAFDHMARGKDTKVMMTDLNGNTKVVLENAMYPQWSPDGVWIACLFKSNDPLTRMMKTGAKIMAVRADGTGQKTIADYIPVDYKHVDDPVRIAWAPNSRQIAFASRVSPMKSRYGIFLADLDGKKTPFILGEKNAEVSNPAMTRDGKQVAFVRWQEKEDQDTGEFTIVAVDVIRGKERVLARVPGKDRGQVASLSWSPDGNWLAYRWQIRVVRLVRADGSEQKELSADPTSLAALVEEYGSLAGKARDRGAFGKSRKNAKRAIAYADDFARRFPTSKTYGDAMITKAKCLLMLNRPQAAADLLDSLSFARPNPKAERQAQFQLAQCHVALGQYRDALAIWGGLAELFRKDPIAEQSRTRIKEIEAALAKAQKLTGQLTKKKDPAAFLDLAEVYSEKLLDPKKSTEALQSLLKEFPNSKEAKEAKGLLTKIKEKFAKE